LIERRDAENLALLEVVVERFPEDPEIRLLFATALLPFRPAEVPWQAATAIQLDPDDPGRLTRAASILFHLDELEAARSYAARASRLMPPGFALASDLLSLGAKFAAMDGDPELAEEALREAVDAAPDREDLARDLATFLADCGRQTEALAVIDAALTTVRHQGKLIGLRDKLAAGS
jgi:Flp pilus assembly protein TadD